MPAEVRPETRTAITEVLARWQNGDENAIDRLMPLVYPDLRRIAYRVFSGENPGHTLTPTAVVNEAYIKLVDQNNASFASRAHFFAIAARIMRRILIDYARRRSAKKREVVASDPPTVRLGENRVVDAIALGQALSRLESVSPRRCRVVELRYFSGLTVREIAESLEVSPRTVKLDWSAARTWLYRELEADKL